jgi:hypothetical protein
MNAGTLTCAQAVGYQVGKRTWASAAVPGNRPAFREKGHRGPRNVIESHTSPACVRLAPTKSSLPRRSASVRSALSSLCAQTAPVASPTAHNAAEVTTKDAPLHLQIRGEPRAGAGIVVRDGNGHAVGTLGRSDFQLFDNGKPQMISQVFRGENRQLTPRKKPPSSPSGVERRNSRGRQSRRHPGPFRRLSLRRPAHDAGRSDLHPRRRPPPDRYRVRTRWIAPRSTQPPASRCWNSPATVKNCTPLSTRSAQAGRMPNANHATECSCPQVGYFMADWLL